MAFILDFPLSIEVLKILDSEIPNISCVSSGEHTFIYYASTKMICIIYYRLTTRWQNFLLHVPQRNSLARLSEPRGVTAASALHGNDMGYGYSLLEVCALIKTL